MARRCRGRPAPCCSCFRQIWKWDDLRLCPSAGPVSSRDSAAPGRLKNPKVDGCWQKLVLSKSLKFDIRGGWEMLPFGKLKIRYGNHGPCITWWFTTTNYYWITSQRVVKLWVGLAWSHWSHTTVAWCLVVAAASQTRWGGDLLPSIRGRDCNKW